MQQHDTLCQALPPNGERRRRANVKIQTALDVRPALAERVDWEVRLTVDVHIGTHEVGHVTVACGDVTEAHVHIPESTPVPCLHALHELDVALSTHAICRIRAYIFERTWRAYVVIRVFVIAIALASLHV